MLGVIFHDQLLAQVTNQSRRFNLTTRQGVCHISTGTSLSTNRHGFPLLPVRQSYKRNDLFNSFLARYHRKFQHHIFPSKTHSDDLRSLVLPRRSSRKTLFTQLCRMRRRGLWSCAHQRVSLCGLRTALVHQARVHGHCAPVAVLRNAVFDLARLLTSINRYYCSTSRIIWKPSANNNIGTSTANSL